MHVGLNALHLVPGETGGAELYTRRLVPALLEARSDLRMTLFVPREATTDSWPREVEVVPLPITGRSRVRRVFAEQTLLGAKASRSRLDLLHNLFSTAPAFPRVPQVTTVLDVIYKRYPETHQGLRSYGMRLLVPLAARRSRRVIAISEAAKSDIVRFLGVEPDRVDVTYLGPALSPAATVSEEDVRARLDLGDAPVVLTLSAKRPHKNLERLLDAFARLDGPGAPVLVVPGYETVFEADLKRRAGPRVRFTGWLDDPLLDGLLRTATCFVFPSLVEGFGLPVLDALERGVPVACSNTSSLPEVAGEAALYFDPTDTAAIADSIRRLLGDEALRERLRAAGPEQARKFSWKATAEATLASYERAMSGSVSGKTSGGRAPG